jgi:hypothetical protein
MELIGLQGEHNFPGNSLVGLCGWEGRVRDADHLPILSETTSMAFSDDPRYPATRGPMKSVVLGQYHYIKNGDGREELYHFDVDPQEQTDLAGSPLARTILERCRVSLPAPILPSKQAGT